jgi:hypothetical protein
LCTWRLPELLLLIAMYKNSNRHFHDVRMFPMGLVKVSEDVMVLSDPPGMRYLDLLAILLVFCLLGFIGIYLTFDIVSLLVFYMLFMGAVVIIYNRTKMTLDRTASKIIIERSTLIGSKTNVLPIKKISKLILVEQPSRWSRDHYLDFLAKDGSSIAKVYLNQDDADRVQNNAGKVASFLGVPLEKRSLWQWYK